MTTCYKLDEEEITDALGYKFQVQKEADKRVILNSIPHGTYNKITPLIKSGVKEFIVYPDDDSAETVRRYKKIFEGETVSPMKNHTLGRYGEGVY
ncbi:MAG TPA: hypothetical protein ENN13_01485 [Candidatus Altiarchaeales archaeon]|nr:hypothetical protein [Candidatus Altiarchaeales archaeon]